MLGLLRFFNRSTSPQQIRQSAYEIIQDESHNFRLKQYYIRPQEQIKQLAADFDNIKIYSWNSGLQITTQQGLITNTDMWLYYLCRIK
jgi:hypothetical protein